LSKNREIIINKIIFELPFDEIVTFVVFWMTEHEPGGGEYDGMEVVGTDGEEGDEELGEEGELAEGVEGESVEDEDEELEEARLEGEEDTGVDGEETDEAVEDEVDVLESVPEWCKDSLLLCGLYSLLVVDGPFDDAVVDGLVDGGDGEVEVDVLEDVLLLDVLVVTASASNPSNEIQSTLSELPSTPSALLIAELEMSSWPFTQFKINNVKKMNRVIIWNWIISK
jgi:hypothetical protein